MPKRDTIVTLGKHTSLSQRSIANECGVSLCAVNKILKQKRDVGSFDVQRIGKFGKTRKPEMKLI